MTSTCAHLINSPEKSDPSHPKLANQNAQICETRIVTLYKLCKLHYRMITARCYSDILRIVRVEKMSATGEVENPVVVQPSTEAAMAQATEKPVKEKKSRVRKQKKPKSAKSVTHPPYFEMIKEALLALNEKGGSSPYAVAKYMEDKHKDELPANFRKILGLQLKNSAAKGKLIKIKASYKLSVAGKKDITTKPSTKKLPKADSKRNTRSATTASQKTEAPKKAKATPKPKKVGDKRTRKSTPARAKQPKSIKSPAAKRAKKVAA